MRSTALSLWARALVLAASAALFLSFITPTIAAPATDAAGVSELLGDHIARFYAPGADPAKALPSFALYGVKAKTGEVPANWAITPVFSKTEAGKQRVHIDIPAGTSLYGTGEVAGPLLRNGRTVTLWNTDAYGYPNNAASLYQSHPWVFAIRADGTAFGVMADTTWRTEINLTGGITFTSEGPEFPVIIVDRPTPEAVCSALAELIGYMPLPPKWAIGFHQCRYSYNPEARVREIAEGFRSRKIPCDVIWFDIDYMNQYRVFTFDAKQFPDVKKLNDDLGNMGFHRIWMIDPGVKNEEGYFVHDQVIKGDFAVKKADGSLYTGAVWPGLCVYPDFTNDSVRRWWAGLYKDFMAKGISGVWNDMNEPAVFNVASKTMPEDNQHKGGKYAAGADVSPVDVPGGPHARFHNVYGLLMAQGTFDGIATANPDVRPFVLTRAGYLGSHRYAATWTGDNSATWNDLEQSVPMALNLGLSGQPFCGPDIGGFNGNGPCQPADVACKGQFYARWMGVGALMPFSRSHTAKGNDNKEPWAYDAATEKSVKFSLERRYRLLPYYYTLFRQASVDGVPVVRPVFFADPKDAALRSEDDCFLIGSDILVVPSFMPDRSRVPATPKGLWRKIDLGLGDDPYAPELRLRAGAIVPIGPVMEYTGQKPLDPLTLIVALDAKGEAKGRLYEDAGEGYAYRKGEYRLTDYVATSASGAVTVKVTKAEGKMAAPKRQVIVNVISDGKVFSATGDETAGIVVHLQ